MQSSVNIYAESDLAVPTAGPQHDASRHPGRSTETHEDAAATLARDEQYLIPVYAQYEVVMERGEGCELFDADGRRYLDLMGGLGVNALGHGHPRMLAAMTGQAATLVHLSPQYSNQWRSKLAEELCRLSGMAGVFFSTGGSEAVEGALKLARTHGRQLGGARKHGLVALHKSYHGRTFGSMSVTGQEKYSIDFGPALPGVHFVERNDIAALRAAVNHDTCAILLEPILGEGGVLMVSNEFLAEARRLADETGALLIFDEIQCGLGRAGTWFAFEASGIKPDMLILGKPLGGGIPLSALLVTETIFHSFGVAKHGSTLGGTPLGCRLGVEFLEVMRDERVLENVQRVGTRLKQRLKRLQTEFAEVVEVRGEGLILGMELTVPARPIVEEGLRRGMMFNCVQGNVLRFLPPLILTEAQADEAMDVLDAVMAKMFVRVPEMVTS
jgi:predicted acetylornithine/succinylornithine family transaminase